MNLMDADSRRDLLARLGALRPDSAALWGRMNVGQAVCHLADPFRIALGELDVAPASTIFTRTVLRWMVLAGVPAPKGKVVTYPEIDQVKGAGTSPTDLAGDVNELSALIARFVARGQAGERLVPSPAFGPLSARQYGRLMALHMDHHLRQFGA